MTYIQTLQEALTHVETPELSQLIQALRGAWAHQKCVYICGNGGSAGNAVHLANDFTYGIAMKTPHKKGLRVEALSANTAVITCLANDVGYASIFSQQLRVKADKGDVLIALSGSGNSPNIIQALEVGNEIGMQTFAILGYSGGKCKDIAQHPLHIQVNDMQVAEDLQLIIGHMCMQALYENPVMDL